MNINFQERDRRGEGYHANQVLTKDGKTFYLVINKGYGILALINLDTLELVEDFDGGFYVVSHSASLDVTVDRNCTYFTEYLPKKEKEEMDHEKKMNPESIDITDNGFEMERQEYVGTNIDPSNYSDEEK